jgi:NADH:ubiquinone oxidoreductase subunit C
MLEVNAKKKIMLATWYVQKKIVNFFKKILGTAVKTVASFSCYEIEIGVACTNVYPAMLFLAKHTNCRLLSLIDIAVYDMLSKPFRFVIVYSLLSSCFSYRLRLVTKVKDLGLLLSVASIYTSAKWSEREVWDFFGIYFLLNNDLRRILTDYGFRGYPLRKDFPLVGYVESFYDDSRYRVVYKPVELAQEFRSFNFQTPWGITG